MNTTHVPKRALLGKAFITYIVFLIFIGMFTLDFVYYVLFCTVYCHCFTFLCVPLQTFYAIAHFFAIFSDKPGSIRTNRVFSHFFVAKNQLFFGHFFFLAFLQIVELSRRQSKHTNYDQNMLASLNILMQQLNKHASQSCG